MIGETLCRRRPTEEELVCERDCLASAGHFVLFDQPYGRRYMSVRHVVVAGHPEVSLRELSPVGFFYHLRQRPRCSIVKLFMGKQYNPLMQISRCVPGL